MVFRKLTLRNSRIAMNPGTNIKVFYQEIVVVSGGKLFKIKIASWLSLFGGPEGTRTVKSKSLFLALRHVLFPLDRARIELAPSGCKPEALPLC